MLTLRLRAFAPLRHVLVFVFLALPLFSLMTRVVYAQEVTPEVTPEATHEATPEATAEVTPEATAALPPNVLLDFPGAGDYTVQLGVDNRSRTTSVYIPLSYETSSEAFPLVVVLLYAG